MSADALPAVLADNCGTLSDCFSNNLLPALLVVLGLVAIVALAWYAWPVLLRVAAGPVLRAVLGTAARSRIAAGLARGLGGRAASRAAARGTAEAAARQAQRVVTFSARQLQSKFKHAGDFGVRGNYSRANGEALQRAIEAHVRDAGTQVIQGTYRGQQATHFYNPTTGLNVIRDARGAFQAGWRLSRAQVEHLLRNGALGGG